jgi:hypothetical protein
MEFGDGCLGAMAQAKMGWQHMCFDFERGCCYGPEGRENPDERCWLHRA